MGAEAENKPEEKQVEEKKEEEIEKPEGGEETKKTDDEPKDKAKKPEGEEEKKAEEIKEPPPPEDIILKVFMHCEGCAKKVRKCLKGFDGVEDVQTDCKTSKVIVKGGKADPLKVLDRVQKKSHKQVELMSPIPKPPVEGENKEEDNKENVKPVEEKKEEEVILTVVLKVHMHCEACAQEIQKRIMRMKGVKNAEADTKSSQVTVIGVFDPLKLVEYVYKRTGKHAMIVKTEPEKKEEGEPEKAKEENAEKKEEGGEAKEEAKPAAGGEGEVKPAEGGEGEAKPAEGGEGEATKVVELKANEYYYFPPPAVPKYYTMENYAYPPQIFSDENPNACSVM